MYVKNHKLKKKKAGINPRSRTSDYALSETARINTGYIILFTVI